MYKQTSISLVFFFISICLCQIIDRGNYTDSFIDIYNLPRSDADNLNIAFQIYTTAAFMSNKATLAAAFSRNYGSKYQTLYSYYELDANDTLYYEGALEINPNKTIYRVVSFRLLNTQISGTTNSTNQTANQTGNSISSANSTLASFIDQYAVGYQKLNANDTNNDQNLPIINQTLFLYNSQLQGASLLAVYIKSYGLSYNYLLFYGGTPNNGISDLFVADVVYDLKLKKIYILKFAKLNTAGSTSS